MARVLDAPPAMFGKRPISLSLRTKGILAVSVVVALVVLTGLFVADKRQGLVRIVQEVETNQATQGMLGTVINQLARSMLGAPSAQAEAKWNRELRLSLERVREVMPALEQEVRDLEELVDIPRDRLAPAALAELRDREQQLISKLHDLLKSLQERSRALADDYRTSQRAISLAIITTHVTAVLGSLVAVFIFFTRIARDIKALQDRAVAIVDGYSGAPLPNTRRDEIGGLIDAVNRMQVDLRRSEQQQEITRQQRFHQEKMAAVGSMASAIGHEVSNPIAAISGVAQFMVEETRTDDSPKSKALHDFAAEILRQSQRITGILRQLGTLTTPPSPEPRLLDLNELVQSTCAFIRYDKRFRRVYFDLELDPGLPAVMAVADHMTQILMNLLINAADAMDHIVVEGAARIRVATRAVEGGVQVILRDNGRGMSAQVLAKAFEESFTTKPAGRGRGIGLFLCKKLIEEDGGRIVLDSTPEVGTTVTLFLPATR